MTRLHVDGAGRVEPTVIFHVPCRHRVRYRVGRHNVRALTDVSEPCPACQAKAAAERPAVAERSAR